MELSITVLDTMMKVDTLELTVALVGGEELSNQLGTTFLESEIPGGVGVILSSPDEPSY